MKITEAKKEKIMRAAYRAMDAMQRVADNSRNIENYSVPTDAAFSKIRDVINAVEAIETK